MNNREYANTLTDKDFVEWGRKFFGKDWDDASVVMSYNEIKDSSITILNKEHETTADEDFAEIGFFDIKVSKKDLSYFAYEDGNKRQVYIFEKVSQYFANNIPFNDELIDKIRTIADKKRKEMNW